jgi:5,10-methylenetetrahydrofolate reductase
MRSLVVTRITFLGINIPVIPGIMPIQTYSSFARVAKLCGARVPDSLSAELEKLSVRLFQKHRKIPFSFTYSLARRSAGQRPRC